MKENEPPYKSIPPHPASNRGGVKESKFSCMILLRVVSDPPEMTPRRCVSQTPGGVAFERLPNMLFSSPCRSPNASGGTAMIKIVTSETTYRFMEHSSRHFSNTRQGLRDWESRRRAAARRQRSLERLRDESADNPFHRANQLVRRPSGFGSPTPPLKPLLGRFV